MTRRPLVHVPHPHLYTLLVLKNYLDAQVLTCSSPTRDFFHGSQVPLWRTGKESGLGILVCGFLYPFLGSASSASRARIFCTTAGLLAAMFKRSFGSSVRLKSQIPPPKSALSAIGPCVVAVGKVCVYGSFDHHPSYNPLPVHQVIFFGQFFGTKLASISLYLRKEEEDAERW